MHKLILFLLLLTFSPISAEVNSGLVVGERAPAHHPTHITGPDAGTDICPV
jgi:hypothetical protein